MYLPADFSQSIFVCVKKKQHPLKFPKGHIRTVCMALCMVIALLPVQGQEIWPGDVSGNGIVDHQDVLFWAYARNNSGGMRPDASTDFSGQPMPEELLSTWSGTFPGMDRSLAYADCDGNGVVDDLDMLVIEQNYYLAVSGPSVQDQFTMGQNPIASQLVLGDDAILDVTAGEETKIPLKLATQDTQAIELGYLGFQLNYGTDLIAETINGDPFLFLDMDLDGNEWFIGDGTNIRAFIHHHENLGFSDIAVFMDTPGDFVSGTGAMVAFTIVVEEVVFGLQDINIGTPLILDGKFKQPGFTAGQGITLNLVGKPVSTDNQLFPLDAVSVFPNPVNTGVLHAQLKNDQSGNITQLELYDQTGKLVLSHAPNARAGQLNANNLPAGIYALKVITDAGVWTVQVKATR